MPEFPLDPDLAALSAALGGLSPTPVTLNRDRLLYEAGRRAAAHRSVTWPIVAGCFAVLSVGLGARMAMAPTHVEFVYVSGASRERERPEIASKEKTPVEKTPVADAPGSPFMAYQPRPAGAVYLQLRDQVVRFGADSLPAVVVGSSAPSPPIEKMLGLPKGTLSDTQKSRWEHQLFQGGV